MPCRRLTASHGRAHRISCKHWILSRSTVGVRTSARARHWQHRGTHGPNLCTRVRRPDSVARAPRRTLLTLARLSTPRESVSSRRNKINMSLDEEVWTQRLEKSAIAATVLSLFANVGINSGYNTSVCLFAVYSAYARNGRVNAVSAAMMLTSILIDVTLYGRFMSTRSTALTPISGTRCSLKSLKISTSFSCCLQLWSVWRHLFAGRAPVRVWSRDGHLLPLCQGAHCRHVRRRPSPWS
jgi:hypothetical protein